MKIREVHEFSYDEHSEHLMVEFSLENDDIYTYRTLYLTMEDITESIVDPFIMDEQSISEIMEDEHNVIDTVEYFLETNPDSLPKEELL
jgi:hypothetical protein